MKKSPLSDANRLHHMLDFAQKILHHTQHMTRETLADDELDLMGIIRLLELIGEAASRVSPKTQAEHPEIDWIGIIGMRNRVIHSYFDIDLNIVWDTITHNIPDLIQHLNKIIANDENQSS